MKKIVSIFTLLVLGFLCFAEDANFSVLMKNAKKYEQEKKFVYAIGAYLDAHAAGKTLEEKKLAYNNYFQIADAIAFGKPGLGEYDEFSLHDEWMKLLDDFDAYWLENYPKTVFINNFEWGNVDLQKKTQKMTFGISMPESKKYTLIKDVIQNGLKKCDKSFWNDTGERGPIYNLGHMINGWNPSEWWNDEKYISEDYVGVFDFLDSNGKKLLNCEIPSEHARFNNAYESDISNTYRSFIIDISQEYIDLISTVCIGDFYSALINDWDDTKANYNIPIKKRKLNYILTVDEPDYAQFQPEEIKDIVTKCSPYEAVEKLMVSLPGRDIDILATDLCFLLKKDSKEKEIKDYEKETFLKNLNSFAESKDESKYEYKSESFDKAKYTKYTGYNKKYTDYTTYYYEAYGCNENVPAIKKPNYLGLYDLVDGDFYLVRNRITEEEKQKRIEKLKKEGDAKLAVEKNEAAIEEFIKASRDNTQQVPSYYITAENISLLVDYLNTHGGTNPYVQIAVKGNINSFEEISSAIRKSKFLICLYLYTDSNPVDIESFNDCLALARIDLPENIKTIKRNAFSGCKNLQVVAQLNTAITKIEENAFLDCNRIDTVWVKGTEKQWKKVKIDKKGNQTLLNVKVQYY